MPIKALGLVVAAAMALPASGALAQVALTGADIQANIIGKRIYLATPFGGEFPLNYLASGEVNGDGEALGLGQFVQPDDTGRWWIEGDQLCQQFHTWYDGAAMCFILAWIGPNEVSWVRSDGDTGTARIEG